MIREQYGAIMPDQKVCYTVHNFRYQGTSHEWVLWATRLGRPDYFLDADRLGDDFRYRGLNPVKAGVANADFVITVSPGHAGEAMYGDGGFRLGRTLKEHQVKFRGVLNGVDCDVWNPETDPFVPVHYSVSTVERKQGSKEVLRDRFWLRNTCGPLVAYIGRLDEQKGMHLVHTGNQAIESALSRALRLWSGQPSQFSELAANCMRADYSWALPGADYLDIYQDIRHR